VSEGVTSVGEVRFVVRDGVGFVTIARPGKKNALTMAMWRAIPGVFAALEAREDVVGIVMQGEGGNFGAGADLEDVLAATSGRAEALAYCTDVANALLAVATSPLPTLALMDGVAAGGGAELALMCDQRIAQDGATICFPFARIGVVPDRFTLGRLVGLVGHGHASRLVFSGESIDASRAASWGLIDEAVAAGGLPSVATAWAGAIARGSKSARAGMKRTFLEREGPLDVPSLIAPMVESFLGDEVKAAATRFLARP
jgi:enoyl-CoA hydratase/carnithine racemase